MDKELANYLDKAIRTLEKLQREVDLRAEDAAIGLRYEIQLDEDQAQFVERASEKNGMSPQENLRLLVRIGMDTYTMTDDMISFNPQIEHMMEITERDDAAGKPNDHPLRIAKMQEKYFRDLAKKLDLNPADSLQLILCLGVASMETMILMVKSGQVELSDLRKFLSEEEQTQENPGS